MDEQIYATCTDPEMESVALPSPSGVHSHPVLVSVVIVNINGASYIPRIIQHLHNQSFKNFEIIFVDNGSRDNSVQLIREICSKYTIPYQLIQHPYNTGFAAACNAAISVARGQWIALLNNDAWPEPRWLETLLAATTTLPNVGMVAAKLLFAHRPDRINSAGIALDRTGIAWDRLGGAIDNDAETHPVEIFGPSGGAALYSKEMLNQLGGFDEDFFAYLEDVDLAWRARLAGWRCLFQPQARVYHVHSATLGEGSPFKHYLLGRNKVWLLLKNYPTPLLVRTLPLILAYDLMAALVKSWRIRSLAPIRGRLAALQAICPMWRKRQVIQRRWRNVENWLRHTEPVAPPWSVLRRYTHLS